MAILSARTYTIASALEPSLLTAITDPVSSPLDDNNDYQKRTSSISIGYFGLSTVSSYLESYMTYDSNPMFAEL